jgi:pimeloyl-ACP methyl ester carboxylesterase
LRRTTVLNGVGHNAPQEAPDLFAAAILDLDR